MLNPFKDLLGKTGDKDKDYANKQLSNKCWEISKKVMSKSLKKKDINELENMYKSYFKKYPDEKAEKDAKDRLNKLKTFV